MFNTTLSSLFAKYGPNSVLHKIGLKNQKTNTVRRRHRRNLKCRATPPSGQQEQQCVFFSFFFEGTKSLSAILNLQPGIEIHTYYAAFQKDKTESRFFWLSGVVRRCDGNFYLLHFFQPITRQQTSQKSIL